MRRYLRVILAFVIISAAVSPVGMTSAQDSWEIVGTGVSYQEFTLTDPNHVYVARMERANTGVTLETALAQGRIVNARERVSEMVQRYEESLITWGNAWGNRAHVIAAINGSYIDTQTWQVLSGQIVSGWYAKRFDDLTGGSGFGWTRDREPFIGLCVGHQADKQVITFANGSTQEIQGINRNRGEGELIIYSPQYYANTLTTGGVEILVQMGSPAGIKPLPYGVPGTVRQIFNGQGSTPIPFDHVVLSASGSAAATLLANVQVGDVIRISQEIKNYDENCEPSSNISWTSTYASISGTYEFLREGQIYSFTDAGAINKHPRTAILFNDNYVYFVVVDGRDEEYSVGMTIEELAYFGRDVLGATWGIAQDGGGSSTMVINGVVMNRPAVTCNEVYLPTVMNQADPGSIDPGSIGEERTPSQNFPEPKRGVCQRPVGNGLMMVEVMQGLTSPTYAPGGMVIASASLDLRLGPGWNYPAHAGVSKGSLGTILDHPTGLNGIYAKGSYWWQVNFNGVSGWVAEEQLMISLVMKLPRLSTR